MFIKGTKTVMIKLDGLFSDVSLVGTEKLNE